MSTYIVPDDADIVVIPVIDDTGFETSGDLIIQIPSPSVRSSSQPTLKLIIRYSEPYTPTNFKINRTSGSMVVDGVNTTSHVVASPPKQTYVYDFVLDNSSSWVGHTAMVGTDIYW